MSHSPVLNQELEAIRRILSPKRTREGPLPTGSSAVLFSLVPAPTGLFFLFERRPPGNSRFAGHLSFPGGRIEPSDASPLEAALREAHEEIGFSPAKVHVLGHLVDTPDPMGRQVACFLGLVPLEEVPEHPASPNEVEEIILLPVADLLRPMPAATATPKKLPPQSYRALEYDSRTVPSQEKIVQYWRLASARGRRGAILWGFTAGVVALFLNRVYGWAPPAPPRIVSRWEDLLP